MSTNDFATRNESGDVIFPQNQKCHIINIVERNLSLDGSDDRGAGGPSHLNSKKRLL